MLCMKASTFAKLQFEALTSDAHVVLVVIQQLEQVTARLINYRGNVFTYHTGKIGNGLSFIK